MIGEPAIVSSDPVAPDGEAPQVLYGFLNLARERGWQVVLWGASARHLDAYRQLGLRAVCAGEEAFVDPSAFTLEGRRVRKLRQSVHRVERCGWQISACEGRELAARLESENRCGRGELASRQGAARGYFAATDPTGLRTLDLGSEEANQDARVPRDDRLDTDLEVRPTFVGFYVGQQDSRFLTVNILLDRGFSAHHIAHRFEIQQGGHSGSLWRKRAPLWLGVALEHLPRPRRVR